jgi:uncharacterized membrane protein
MAAATYLTRVFGFWLVSLVSIRGRARAALEAVPGAVLTAAIAPMVIAGPAEAVAAVATLAIARYAPVIVAVVGGVATVAALRAVIV